MVVEIFVFYHFKEKIALRDAIRKFIIASKRSKASISLVYFLPSVNIKETDDYIGRTNIKIFYHNKKDKKDKITAEMLAIYFRSIMETTGSIVEFANKFILTMK